MKFKKLIKEEINNIIQEKKSSFDVKSFVKEIEDEWDLQTLSLLKKLITDRERKVKSMIDMATRNPIKGFRK